jgi:D-beta-D-heptose 7-phosphate kinase/D-beta-D-heptose 1-phosphate adenosyltransferase
MPNRVEAFPEAGVPDSLWQSRGNPLQDEMLLRVGQLLLEKWETQMVKVTRERSPHHILTVAPEVFDVSGAGDTGVVLFTLALTAGASPVEAA